ncbi:aldehyde dehydrogenase (NADP(+)) [Cryobacterium melibiosiphilum]|uniref:Aldehyde dehydrogenase (NADP(+)) n=1 Tax=Cryobacterium melibiosiphilum TaxID=995039 RepID=A0A3A5MHV8_9MICO|nr:aldehyde dehydrogenase (NADP(+)) [Cryobacterium melibiosiphilum]RJT89760.1 aldehyde dehydrogenase (NADP(+)) [Cryobacterium melibiosiphilum]
MNSTDLNTIPPTELSELEVILSAAELASGQLRRGDRTTRATYLIAIADALDAAADPLVLLAHHETQLTEVRLRGELNRTTFQLRLFAEAVADARYLDVRIDHADPEWPMGARPDLRRTHIPIGPVAVFAASNFPFAFSVAGGDTASALAAGCPVVVKAHSGHAELSRETAQVVSEALATAGAPPGSFALVFGTAVGRALVQDPRIKAAGFTGSISGGRALFELAQSRPEPIPFFGELGSNNPVFVTQAADTARGAEIAGEFIASFTLGSGQFCTKPGTVLVPLNSRMLATLRKAKLPDGAPMLNERIRSGYVESVRALQAGGAEIINAGPAPYGDIPSPILHLVSAADVLANPSTLLAECFGPSALVIEYDNAGQLGDLALAFEGQLTASIQAENGDDVAELIDTLMVKAGRVLWNQWPTGVSVTYAQQHGGPYPASTSSVSTSVGVAAIGRFVRPVALQGFPQRQLPDELREDSADPVPRLVDGR